MVRNVKLVLAYDGSRYRGWQRQRSAPTVQGVLEEKIAMITREPVKLIGSGRTDAGVHACHQVCNFKTPSRLAPETIKRALNALLPEDIFVQRAEEVSPGFHARYSARSKTYEYRILYREEPDIFLRAYTWHVKQRLDLEAMAGCLPLLKGRLDFSAFRSTGSGERSPVREMARAEMLGPREGLLTFLFEADGFLRHMVRNILGTVVEVGKGRYDIEGFRAILQSGDRQRAGTKAPAQGLFLKMVRY